MQRKSTTGRGKGALSGSVIISFFINTEKVALKFSFMDFFITMTVSVHVVIYNLVIGMIFIKERSVCNA